MTAAAAIWMLAMSDACAWPATPPDGAFLRVEHGAEVAELTASGQCGAAVMCVRVDAAEMSAQWQRARTASSAAGKSKRGVFNSGRQTKSFTKISACSTRQQSEFDINSR